MSGSPDDGELVALTLRGHPEAFATLVERYDRAVYHLAYRTLHDVEDARDATQEAFFKAFRSLRTFKPGAKFCTWIFAIAYHACCDRLNRRKHFTGEELPERADAGPGPEAQVIALDEAPGCAPRSTRCRRNTARSSPSFTCRESSTRRSPRCSTSRWVRSRHICFARRSICEGFSAEWR